MMSDAEKHLRRDIEYLCSRGELLKQILTFIRIIIPEFSKDELTLENMKNEFVGLLKRTNVYEKEIFENYSKSILFKKDGDWFTLSVSAVNSVIGDELSITRYDCVFNESGEILNYLTFVCERVNKNE